MIEAARARAEREGAAADFIVADAQTHAFERAGFDLLVSRFGIMFFDDPVVAFANLRSAAKPGGGLRGVVWRSPADNPFMTTAERAAAPLLPELPARTPDEPGQFGFADRDRVRRILDESGWSDVEITPVDIACVLPEPALVRYIAQLGIVGRALQQVDEDRRARVLEVVRPAFDAYVHGAEVRFTAACWLVGARA
jgi:SAM-dependent methyltransferase